MSGEIVMKQEWEGLFFVELAIESAGEILDLGFHWGERFQEHVGVATEKITQVDAAQVRIRRFYQLKFPCDHVLSVL